MDRAVTPPFAAAATRRLQRRRWAIRGAAALVLGLSLAYATLPLWLPTDRIRVALEFQLSDDLGMPVRIAGLHVGWLEGVVLESLTVADNGTGGENLLARVGAVRCDLSPFSLALGDTVRELEIVDPQLWLHVDENGQLRLPRFNQKRGSRLPSLNYAVRGLTCQVITPKVSQRFRIDRLNLQLDPVSGLLHLTSATRVQRPAPDADEPKTGRLDFNANIRIPRLKKGEALNGSIEVEWSDLALNDLPVPIISHVPVEQVDGTTNGRLTIQTHPDLGIDFTVAIVLDGVRIMRPDLHRPAQVPDAEVACRGHWDPTEGLLVVQDAFYETPALRIESAGNGVPLLRLEENGDVPLALRLKGQIKDWRELRQELPEFDQVARTAGADFSGQASFTTELQRNRREDRAALQLDGQRSRWIVRRDGAEYLHAETGLPKQIKLESIRERAGGRVRQPAFTLQIGDVQLDAGGEVLLPPTTAADGEPVSLLDQMVTALASLRAHAHLRCDNAANLRRWSTWLAARPEIDALSGPLDLDATVEPQGEWTRIAFSTVLPSESDFRAGELIRKQPGRSLRVSAETRIPYASSGRVDLLNLDVRHGAGRLELASRNGSLKYDAAYREMPSGPALVRADGNWRAELTIQSVEDLVELSPLLSKRLQETGVTFLSGGLETSGVAEFSYRPGDTLVRTRMRFIADNLAIRLQNRVTKKAGEPVSLELNHHWRSGYDTAENYWAAALVGPAGKISGSLLRGADSADPEERFELLTADAGIDDITHLLAAVPGLADRIGLTASGGLSAHLRQIRIGDWQSGTAGFDCTPASFVLESPNPARPPVISGLRKAAGVPMNASAAWEAQPTNDGQGRVFEIRDAQAQLAHATMDHLKGRATVPLACTSFSSDPTSAGSIEASGSVQIDEHLESIHPAIREQLRRASGKGTASWHVGVDLQAQTIGIQGQFDGTNFGFSTALNDTPFSLIRKPVGEPFVATIEMTCPRPSSDEPGRIEVRHAAIHMSDNSILAHGTITQAMSGQGGLQNSTALDVSADLPHLERLLNWLPGAPIEWLKGGLLAEVSVLARDGAFTVSSGRADLNEVELGSAARPLRLDGSLSFAQDAANLEKLDFDWGKSRGTLSGTLTNLGDQYEARVGFRGHEMNIEDLLSCVGQLQAGFSSKADKASPDTQPANQAAARIVDLLRRTHATVDAQADTVSTPLPLGIKATFDAGWQQLDLRDGKIGMEFACLVDGGRVNGQVTADLNTADPKYRLTYTADRIQPGAVVDAYLRRTFPGMVATGPLTLIDETVQKLTPAPGEPNPEIGKGELIIDGGTVTGRAAPLWVTRIFPGLNLSSFQFTRMHSWFEKDAIPRVHHQMIYQGDYYNVYMIGWSNPQGHFEYEVGIDFLAGLESEYWANSGQGRVPLFTKSGQVRPDGSLADEDVKFVSLSRVLETLFVRNNPVVTAYHAVRKRVLGQM